MQELLRDFKRLSKRTGFPLAINFKKDQAISRILKSLNVHLYLFFFQIVYINCYNNIHSLFNSIPNIFRIWPSMFILAFSTLFQEIHRETLMSLENKVFRFGHTSKIINLTLRMTIIMMSYSWIFWIQKQVSNIYLFGKITFFAIILNTKMFIMIYIIDRIYGLARKNFNQGS